MEASWADSGEALWPKIGVGLGSWPEPRVGFKCVWGIIYLFVAWKDLGFE